MGTRCKPNKFRETVPICALEDCPLTRSGYNKRVRPCRGTLWHYGETFRDMSRENQRTGSRCTSRPLIRLSNVYNTYIYV